MMKLTEHQQRVREAFDREETDIDVAVIYTRVYGDAGHLNVRQMQMKLAPSFAALNNKLKEAGSKLKVQVGVVKRTYRLTSCEE